MKGESIVRIGRSIYHPLRLNLVLHVNKYLKPKNLLLIIILLRNVLLLFHFERHQRVVTGSYYSYTGEPFLILISLSLLLGRDKQVQTLQSHHAFFQIS